MRPGLAGRVAVVTGASRGLGRVVARTLHEHGMKVVVAARDRPALEDLEDELGRERCLAVASDVSVAADRERLLLAPVEHFGNLDVLVNNAGLEKFAALQDLAEEEIRRQLEVNLLAAMLLTRDALPGMLGRGWGRIVNMSSLAGLKGVPYGSVYSASKFGLNGFGDALAHELLGTGVTVSSVCPGFVRDEGVWARHQSRFRLRGLMGDCSPAQVAEAVLQAVRTGRTRIDVGPRRFRWGLRLGQLMPSLAIALGGDVLQINRTRAELDRDRVI